jgi:hypothetical protein
MLKYVHISIPNKETFVEQYYIKRGRKYIPAGYSFPDLPEGLWFKSGNRGTSVSHWVGMNPKEPVDINSLISTMRLDEKVAEYIAAIQTDSEEFKQLEEDCGGYVREKPKIYNISNMDLAACILRKIYELAADRSRESAVWLD